MNAPLYTTEILRLAASLGEPRELEREDGRAELRSPTCGSRIGMSVELDNAGRVAALSQRVHACAFGQASAALLERGAIGRTRDDVEQALNELGDWLGGGDPDPGWGLSALAPARSRVSRHGAILLPFRALLAALDSAR
ncbi:MAG: iron-sulfur cluster assembly scaffold protein [Sphingomicrobium sp.]